MQNIEDSQAVLSVKYHMVNNGLTLFFCGYVVIWYLQIGQRMPFLGEIRFEFVYAFLLAIAAVVFTPKLDLQNPLLPVIFLYVIVIAVQVPFSYDAAQSYEVFVNRLLKFAAMTFFIAAFVRSPQQLKWFLGAFLLACFKMGQEGLVGKLTGSLMWQNQGVMRLHGTTPLYTHPNSFAGMALGTLPFVYYLWPICSKPVRFLLGLTTVLSLNIIIFSGSRTGYFGLFIFILYIVFSASRKLSLLIKIIALAAVLSLFIPEEYFGRLQSIYQMQDKEGNSIEKRIEIQNDAIAIFKQNPLGIGVAAFPKKRYDTFGRVQDTHNLYWEVLTNLGIQGFLVFVLLIGKLFSVLRTVIRRSEALMEIVEVRKTSDAEMIVKDLKLLKATALAACGFIVCRLALGLFGMDLYEIYWWFAMGIAFCLYSMSKRVDEALGKPLRGEG